MNLWKQLAGSLGGLVLLAVMAGSALAAGAAEFNDKGGTAVAGKLS